MPFVSSQETFWWRDFLSVNGWDDADHTLVIYGKLISKKNNYKPTAKGMVKTSKIRDCEKMVDIQIPRYMRSLNMPHPRVLVQQSLEKFNADRDNGWTFLLDCLVKSGVVKNDSAAQFNGLVVHAPCIRGTENITVVSFWENGK